MAVAVVLMPGPDTPNVLAAGIGRGRRAGAAAALAVAAGNLGHASAAALGGVECLAGACVTATDVRAAAALVLAGLGARGEPCLTGWITCTAAMIEWRTSW